MAKMSEEAKLKRKAEKEAQKKIDQAQAELFRKESVLQSQLERLQKMPLPNPRFTYQIGDEVKDRTGNRKKMRVVQILENGKIFRCSLERMEREKGPAQVEEQFVSHLEITPLNVKEESNLAAPAKRSMQFYQQSVSSLIHKHYYFGIDYTAPYQRELVWSSEDKENLIHSIFNYIDIGKFAFIELPYRGEFDPNYEILDGKQRLSTLIEFYEDRLVYRGKTFSELSPRDKHVFMEAPISVGLGKDDWTLADRIDYFLRLNISGVPQSQEHLQKVLELQKKYLHLN